MMMLGKVSCLCMMSMNVCMCMSVCGCKAVKDEWLLKFGVMRIEK